MWTTMKNNFLEEKKKKSCSPICTGSVNTFPTVFVSYFFVIPEYIMKRPVFIVLILVLQNSERISFLRTPKTEASTKCTYTHVRARAHTHEPYIISTTVTRDKEVKKRNSDKKEMQGQRQNCEQTVAVGSVLWYRLFVACCILRLVGPIHGSAVSMFCARCEGDPFQVFTLAWRVLTSVWGLAA
jgi:hypothetical protein